MRSVKQVRFEGGFVVSAFITIASLLFLSAPAADREPAKDSSAAIQRPDLTGIVKDAAGKPLNQARDRKSVV